MRHGWYKKHTLVGKHANAPHSMISCSDGQSTAPDTTDRVRVLMDNVVDAEEPLFDGKLAFVHTDHSDQSDTTQSLELLSPNCTVNGITTRPTQPRRMSNRC